MDDATRAALSRERIDILAGMVQDLRAELAHFQTDLAAKEQALTQARAALEAERRAREMAQADNVALVDAARRLQNEYSTKPPFVDPDLRWEARRALTARIAADHPGAALLAELDAARTVVKAVQRCQDDGDCARWFERELAAYDAVVKGDV